MMSLPNITLCDNDLVRTADDSSRVMPEGPHLVLLLLAFSG